MTTIEVDDEVREVVGILGDVRTRGLTTRPTVLVPAATALTLAASTGSSPTRWPSERRRSALASRWASWELLQYGLPYGSVRATSSAGSPRALIAIAMYCLPSIM